MGVTGRRVMGAVLTGLSLIFFFILYLFDIQIEASYGKGVPKVQEPILDESKPVKKKLKIFNDKKWAAVTKELELRKRCQTNKYETTSNGDMKPKSTIDEKWDEISTKSSWLQQSGETKVRTYASIGREQSGHAMDLQSGTKREKLPQEKTEGMMNPVNNRDTKRELDMNSKTQAIDNTVDTKREELQHARFKEMAQPVKYGQKKREATVRQSRST